MVGLASFVRVIAVMVFAVLCHTGFSLTAGVPKNMNNKKCGVMCQRFGMKALGPAFKDIHHPNECMKKCDEVYPKKPQ